MFVYVGQTITPDDFAPHGRAMRKIWHNKKHGLRYIYCIEREWPAVSAEELNAQETRFIFRRNTFNDLNRRGLNFTAGGGCFGRPSAESNAKNAESVRAALADPEWKRKQSAKNKKWWSDPVWKAAVIAKMKKKLADPVFAEARRKALVAALSRPEVKVRNSASKKAAFSSPENRQRLRELGSRPESVANMRRASKIGHSNSVHSAKRIAAIRAAKAA